MSNQRRKSIKSKNPSPRPQQRRGQLRKSADQKHDSLGTVPSTHQQVLALSRTAVGVQSLLDPGRIFETIGGELRDQGFHCLFGLLKDGGAKVVLRHTNLSPEKLQAAEALLGAPVVGHEFGADVSPHIRAVVRDGQTTLDRDFAQVMAEVLPGRAKQKLPELAELLQAHQAISAPLLAGSQVLGILTVWSEQLTEENLPSVSVLAQQAAVALERADLYEEAMQRVFEMEALRKTTLDLTRQLDLSQLLRLIVERAAALIGTKGGGLYLYRPQQDELELVVSLNLGKDYAGTHIKAGEGLSGRVILTGRPLAIEDYSSWENRSSHYDEANMGGVLAVPLKWGDKIIGVVNVTDGPSPRSFDERDVWLLEWFANTAAVAIENARAFGETERKVQQLGALHEISLELLGETDHAHLLLKIVQKATELLDAQAGAIDLFDPQSQRLEMRFSHGYRNDYSAIKLSPGQGVAGRVCETRQPVIVDNYAIWPDRVPDVAADEVRAALGVPLLRGEELLGVLTIDRSDSSPFDEDDIQLATLFANQAAMTLENARLHQEQQQRAQELLALHETSLDVVSRLELHSLLTAIIGRAVQLLEGESGDIYLYRPETEDLISAASHNMPAEVQGVVIKAGQGMSGRILETKQPIIVDNYESWPGRSDTYSGYGFAHVLGVPITYADQFLGVVVVERGRETASFTEGDQGLLTLFAHQAAVAIENSTLFEETRHTAGELEALYEISTEIATQLELPVLLNTITRRALELFGARAGGLYLLDPDTQELELIAALGHTRDRRGIRLAPGEGVCGKVAQSGEPMVVRDYRAWEGRSPHYDDEPTCNVLAVPIKHGDSLVGAFFVDDANLDRVFGETDLRLATLLANQAAVAIRNARLFAERERTIAQLAALQKVSLEVVSKTDPSEVLPTIVRVAAELLDAEAGAIHLYDPESRDLEFSTAYGRTTPRPGITHALGEGVVGKVARTKRPLTVNDYAQWSGRSPHEHEVPVGAVLGVPLMRADQLLGVLTIDRSTARPFDESDLNLATLFASQAAIAIENARTVAATMQRINELTALREISLQLTRSLDLATVLDTIVTSAVRLVQASDAHIFLRDEESQGFVFGSGAWAPGQDKLLFTEVRANGLTATVAKKAEPVVINEARNHPLFRDAKDGKGLVESIAGFPLKRGNKVVGVFNVAFLEPHTFDQDDLRVLTLLADQATIAIENARLYQETDRRLKESQTLQETSRLISSSLEPSAILQTVVETLVSAFGYDMASIYTREEGGFRLGAQGGYDPERSISLIPLDKGVIGRVARTGEAEFVLDVSRDPDYLEAAARTVSEIAVPVKKDHELLGVLNVESSAATPLTTADLTLLVSLAHQVSAAMENARLYQETDRRLKESQTLQETSRLISSSLEPAAILQTVVETLQSALGYDMVSIYISEEGGLRLGTEVNYDPGRAIRFIPLGKGIIGRVARTGEAEFVPDVSRDPDYLEAASGVLSEIAVPVKKDDEVLGVLNVESRAPSTLTAADLTLLLSLAHQVSAAMQNAQLYQAAQRELVERKRAEEAYRAVVDHSLQGIILLQDGRIVFANQTTADIMGYSREELLAMPPEKVREAVHPDDREFVWGRFQDRLAGKEVPPRYECRAIRKDGSVMWMEMFANLVEYRGRPALQAALVDVTERKRAEEAYRAVVDHSLQGIIVVQDSRIVFANQAAADIIGSSPEEALALSPEQVRDLVHPDDQQFVWGRFRERLSGKDVPPQYEYRAIRRDGSMVWVEMFANLVEYRGRGAIQAAIIDVTERKHAEQALRQSEEKFRTLFEDSRDPVYITTLDGNFVDVNESFLAMFGLTRDQLAHMRAGDLYVRSADRRRFQAEIKEKGAVRDYELRLKRGDGSVIDTVLSTTLWQSEDGETLGYQGIIHDITERKRAQEELQKSYAAVRTALAGTVKALAALGEVRDPYTAGHQQRVSWLACTIAEEMGLSEEGIQGIRWAGLVHDIGKIQVPAEILSKPTTLTDVEMQLIKAHPQNAFDILCTVEFPWPVADIVLQHHERLDGSGYPQGLTKEQILQEAKILAVADVVEAMASNRPYRPAHSLQETVDEIVGRAGLLYDSDVVHAFLALLKDANYDLRNLTDAPPWLEQ